MTFEGRARSVGDCYVDDRGEWREIEEIEGGHEYVSRQAAKRPMFGSSAERCALFASSTSGREKRDRDRWIAKHAKARTRTE